MPLQILTLTELAHKYRLSKEEKKDFQILIIVISLLSALCGISITTFFFIIIGA